MIRACLSLIALAIAFTTAADAQPRNDSPRVVVIVADTEDPTAARIQAELAALGFEITVETDTSAVSRVGLEASARRLGAVAAIRVVPQASGAEVWVADRVTGKTAVREVVVPPRAAEHRASIVALRSVELLRASLLEIESRLPRRGEVEPPTPVREVVIRDAVADRSERVPAAARHGVVIGPAIAWGPGGVPLGTEILLAARYAFGPRISAGALVLAPTVPARLCAEEGCSSVSLGIAAADAELALTDPSQSLRLLAGAGLGAGWLRLSGDADPPLVSETEDLLAAVGYGRVGAAIDVAQPIALRADALVGATLPRWNVNYAGRRIAQWGPPFVALALSAELRFE